MSWYYKTGDTMQGPIERAGLAKLLRTGTLTPQIEVSEDQASWMIAAQVPGLMSEVYGAPATAPQAAAAPTAPTVVAKPTPPAAYPTTAVGGPSTALAGPATANQNVSPISAQSSIEISSPTPTQVATPSSPSAVMPGPQPQAQAQPLAPPPVQTTSPAEEPESESTEAAAPFEKVPTGPVGHITLNPAARQQSQHQQTRQKRGGVLKLAVFGLVGLALLLVGGYFTATKVFGLDLRPATVDQSVSKFMVEKPIAVAHVDLQSIFESKSYRRTLPVGGHSNNPIMSYLQDAEDVVVVSNKLDINPEAPNVNFLVIVTLKRDYRKEFVANMFKKGTTDQVGDYQMHVEASSQSGFAVAASLPEPRTFLLGSPYTVKKVLERNAYPKLYPRESELIARTTSSGKSATIGIFPDFLNDFLAEAEEKLEEQMKEISKDDKIMMKAILGNMKKNLDDAQYAAKNIKYQMLEFDFKDRVTITSLSECGSERKAKKIAEIVNSLVEASPFTGDFASLGSAISIAKGSVVESATTFDFSEITDAIAIAQSNTGFSF